MMVHLLFLQ